MQLSFPGNFKVSAVIKVLLLRCLYFFRILYVSIVVPCRSLWVSVCLSVCVWISQSMIESVSLPVIKKRKRQYKNPLNLMLCYFTKLIYVLRLIIPSLSDNLYFYHNFLSLLRNFLTFHLKKEESTLLWWLRQMNLLETSQKLLKKVGCITTLLSFLRQITVVVPGDLTGKETPRPLYTSSTQWTSFLKGNIFQLLLHPF